ncbi:MAG: carboxylating nicotinate-nucleotide diphosphorylase [Nitriliruptorales bacterium]
MPLPERLRDPEAALADLVGRALAEDLGTGGDVTSAACVPEHVQGTGEVRARADGVLAGVGALAETFAQVDPAVEVGATRSDGDRLAPGDVVAVVRGPLRSVLTGERVALNLLGHLSGVATATRDFVDAVAGTGCAVRDTRKTLAGLRVLEKAAVVAGGGENHRIGLDDQLLVKDNHIVAAGGITAAVSAALAAAEGRPVQVEVTSEEELEDALAAGATDVLFDNFAPEELRSLVARVGGRAATEASGRISLETARAYAEAGVDRIAVGGVTHSAAWLDVALDIVGTTSDGSG